MLRGLPPCQRGSASARRRGCASPRAHTLGIVLCRSAGAARSDRDKRFAQAGQRTTPYGHPRPATQGFEDRPRSRAVGGRLGRLHLWASTPPALRERLRRVGAWPGGLRVLREGGGHRCRSRVPGHAPLTLPLARSLAPVFRPLAVFRKTLWPISPLIAPQLSQTLTVQEHL